MDRKMKKERWRTYQKVATSEDSALVLSGMLVPDTDNAASLACQLVCSISSIRCCGIAIANVSEQHLFDPKSYSFSGRVISMPQVIETNHTGLIAAERTSLFVSGCVGVISYRLPGTTVPLYLQVMWSVPFDFNLYTSWVNVSIGEQEACPKLYQDMYTGRKGSVTKACDTSKIFYLGPHLKAEALMGDSGKASLVVRLFRE